MAPPAKPLNALFSSFPTTIFSVMSALAVEHNAVNLGQGFPDEEGPSSMKDIASSSMVEFHNQYPPMPGVPELRQAVAEHSEKYAGVPVDWATETLITVGATEGIASCLMGLLNPGDEVIFFDPMYDSYVGMAKSAGAVIKTVPLLPPTFAVPKEQLEAAFSDKTKLILVNTPHNPTGKIYTREELQYIADLCIKHDVIALCDEVYEHLVFEGHQHVSLRALPGMHERALRLGSAGKTFSYTAWKVGWVTGPAALLAPVTKAHQFLVFTVPSSLQRAVAHGLSREQSFYQGLGAALERKRALLAPRLQALGFGVLPAQGTYFLVADVSRFLAAGEDDEGFCRRLTVEAGVTVIPVSAFYISSEAPRSYVRFCFCKDDAKLVEACARLERYLGEQQQQQQQ